jgi:hypothetical protein
MTFIVLVPPSILILGSLMNHSPAPLGAELPELNPASRVSPTYQEVNTAVLTTAADIERHKARIYQVGYTPSAIRNNINTMLRDSNPDQPTLDSQEKDIPPANRDAHTHLVLTDLLQQRNRMDEDFHLQPASVAKDGTSLLNPRTYEAEYLHRDKEYNQLNRSMYHIYAASAHVIHDNNFLSYCRPALRNLPVATAFKIISKNKIEFTTHQLRRTTLPNYPETYNSPNTTCVQCPATVFRRCGTPCSKTKISMDERATSL